MPKKAFKNAVRPTVLTLFNTLARLEKKLWSDAKLHYSPTFIVAPSRAGTTLLYQVMANHLSTCYFTNLVRWVYIRDSAVLPIFLAHLAKLLKVTPPQKHQFKSCYGGTKGWGGPVEVNMLWEQVFPRQIHAVSSNYLSVNHKQTLKICIRPRILRLIEWSDL